jgi:DNA-binding XRE family transcriptional regulator
VRDVSVDILTGPKAGAPELMERLPGAPRLFQIPSELPAMQETAIGPNEVMNALRRYLENTGETQRAAAMKMGVNRHSLFRWLSDSQNPQKADLLQVAAFLRHAGFL